jgi:hypothetical protein
MKEDKAGVCPVHKKPYELITTSYTSKKHGVTVEDVKAYRCPEGHVDFPVEAIDFVRSRLAEIVEPLALTRTITSAGKHPALSIPVDVTDQLGIGIGSRVRIRVEGKRMIVEKIEETPPLAE